MQMNHPHWDSPKKSRIRGAVEFIEAQNRRYGYDPVRTKTEVFRFEGVPWRTGMEFISKRNRNGDRRHFPPDQEPRGRKPLISSKDIHEMERILEEQDVYGRAMSWEALGYEAGLDVCGRTVKRAIGPISYQIPVEEGPFQRRVPRRAWSARKVDDYSTPGRAVLLSMCTTTRKVEDNAKNNVHVWGAVGYNFKSDLVTYNVPSNTTGKMTQQTYIDSILDPITKPWIQNGHDFVLGGPRLRPWAATR
ncbi:hypothetical protein P152DRAFT_446634 [Eremomyces bilateralis CBS 781.70]|uniref:Uncharacterized protein n=1 Tax=Eremomyces bilateralis CBS 781.70 TaxID=1392243 RepID=A0A6G1GBX2_9PEZI|nr:uncharacterized protein P152DRAFT_446634 [Eremomyces bilateralis CBS 781.70]KAF1815587.1 hypothetical protein P152DRAFT_446634 [Eremomyces bilateralis CBS 781.70]